MRRSGNSSAPAPGGLGRALPLLAQLRGYRGAWLADDLLAGLSVAAVALPIAIAYPAIMGLPPETGLFASIAGLIGYALVGPGRQLMVGPDTATCTMVAATLASLGLPDAGQRAEVAAALALLVGLLMLAGACLRLGSIADFLSRPILIGYLGGVAVALILGQLGPLTGLTIAAKGFLRPLAELVRQLGAIHLPSLLLGLGLLLGLRLLRRLAPRAPGPLLALAVALLADRLLGLEATGVATVGAVPTGLPGLALPWPDSVGLDVLLLPALGITLVSFGSGIVTARSFAARVGASVDASREMAGFAAADLLAGLLSGFPVTGADSRTAINQLVGGRTQLAGLAAALALAAALVWLGDLLAALPVPALAAVLVSAAWDLLDLRALAQLWRISRHELAFALLALIGVVTVGVLQGLAVAIAATLLHLLQMAARPRDALLGRVPGRPGLHKLHRTPAARPVPGLVLYLPEGSLLFFNADHVHRRMRQIIDAQPPETRRFIIVGAGIGMLDSTAAAMLDRFREELAARGVALGFAALHRKPQRLLERAGVLGRLEPGMVRESLSETVEEVRP